MIHAAALRSIYLPQKLTRQINVASGGDARDLRHHISAPVPMPVCGQGRLGGECLDGEPFEGTRPVNINVNLRKIEQLYDLRIRLGSGNGVDCPFGVGGFFASGDLASFWARSGGTCISPTVIYLTTSVMIDFTLAPAA